VTWFVKTARRGWGSTSEESGDQVALRMIALAATVAVSLAVLGLPATAATGQGSKSTSSATEIGVTPTEIHIAVIADVDNPFLPGVLADARDAVLSFAKYINGSCATKNKCLAARKLVVDFYDSHLDSTKTRNAEIQACSNDFAMVGTSALMLESVDDMRNCTDHAGATTGLPDIPFFAGPIVQQCSDESFPVVPIGLRCATKDQHPQTYDSNVARAFYFTKKYGALHGISLFSLDSKSGYNDELVGEGGLSDIRSAGNAVRSDGVFAVSAQANQTAYTPFVQAMKTAGSNYAQCAQPYECAVLLRKEAVLQGVSDQVKVWDCSTCYDKKFLQSGGTDVEHEYIDTGILPFYDPREQKANPMLANFVRFTGQDKIDTYGEGAWAAAVAFRDAVNATVKSHGLNGLTRTNLFAALNGIHKFDADGMIAPHDLANRTITDCHILLQVKNATFVRVQPTTPGTYDCNPKYRITRKLDLTFP
jgi:hypothetical protein